MQISDVQRLLAAAGVYSGGIDNDAGPKTLAGVDRVLGSVGSGWSKKRRLIGAAQKVLNDAGFSAGKVDGYSGHNTENAFSQWQYFKAHGKREVVKRKSIGKSLEKSASKLPTQSQVSSFYGRPGTEIKSRLSTVSLPFSLRLDYNLRQKVKRVTLHEKCAPSFVSAMIDVRDFYGAADMKELGLDRYAGGYNHRNMRGGKSWSMHAYGCAVDFFAQPNGLRMTCPRALFCGDDYKAFLNIMESHDWLPAVRLWGKDAMHFQQARL